MFSEIKLSDQIERYLNGEMTGEELKVFEQQLNNDPLFAGKVIEFEQLTAAIRRYGRRKSLLDKMSQWHSEINEEYPVLPVQKGFYSWARRHFTTIAVAASISAISIMVTLIIVNNWYMSQKQNVKYTELRREIDRIKSSQKAIITDIDGKKGKKPAFAPGRYSGTGFVLSADGYLITSLHVIRDADSVVVANNTSNYRAKVIYKDQYHDLAILKIDDRSFAGFSNIPFSVKKVDALLGENVFTLGYPREEIVYNEGSVSSRSGYEGDTTSYQISIPVNPGNSGGPLFDDKGNLIGIIKGKNAMADAAAFAVKSNYIFNLMDSLSKNSEIRKPQLPQKNTIWSFNRSQQIKKLESFVFDVKVYN